MPRPLTTDDLGMIAKSVAEMLREVTTPLIQRITMLELDLGKQVVPMEIVGEHSFGGQYLKNHVVLYEESFWWCCNEFGTTETPGESADWMPVTNFVSSPAAAPMSALSKDLLTARSPEILNVR